MQQPSNIASTLKRKPSNVVSAIVPKKQKNRLTADTLSVSSMESFLEHCADKKNSSQATVVNVDSDEDIENTEEDAGVDSDEDIEDTEEDANVELGQLKKDWNAPIYAFFHPIPNVDYKKVDAFMNSSAQPRAYFWYFPFNIVLEYSLFDFDSSRITPRGPIVESLPNVASSSCSQTLFKEELIECRDENNLSQQTLGSAVWKDFESEFGYYVYHDGRYQLVEYDDEKRVWYRIRYSESKHSWVTTTPAPLEFGLGPWRENPPAIITDSEPEEYIDESSEDAPALALSTPLVAPAVVTIRAPALTTPQISIQSADTITPFHQNMLTIAAQLPDPTPPLPPPPPAIPNIPPPSGRLLGILPQTFTGDRSQSKKFMLEFTTFKNFNHDVAQIVNPFQRANLFLSLIRGDAVDDWTMEQLEWLNEQVESGRRTTSEGLWETIAQRFKDAFTDGQAKQKAARELKSLRMEKGELDAYVAKF
ncbi:hypothetical protein B0F90DRAFT_1817941 [Multifurca ochricompacta]|uniref:Retrotransposon gag domain-containing protein n=1 Tax=Multifurca ochricompacta TaxID=376703 RepID=A0AAD4M3E1_9AGAM|nr:hypothetical protein B0F90DRAFT_1817941 [Multifurca ochricompacta]